MKLIAKVLLTILFLPLFLIFILSVNVRFQLLNPIFWEKTLTSNNVYSELASSITGNLENRMEAEGIPSSEGTMITDLITPENLQELATKNIENILTFANGKATDLIVFIPINRIPKSSLPTSLGKFSEEMKLTDLLTTFNVPDVTDSQIKNISQVGKSSFISFSVLLSLLLLDILGLYFLTTLGKRMVAPALAFLLAGTVSVVLFHLGTVIKSSLIGDYLASSNLGDVIIGTVASPFVVEILKVWRGFGIGAILLGILLLFVKRPNFARLKKAK